MMRRSSADIVAFLHPLSAKSEFFVFVQPFVVSGQAFTVGAP
jgi:hypothetical protein